MNNISYRIKGTFNGGLKAFKNEKLIFYSKKKGYWTSKTKVSIYDENDALLLEFWEKGIFSKTYVISYQNLDHDISVSRKWMYTNLYFGNNVFSFYNHPIPIPFIVKNYGRLFLNNKEIGFIKTGLYESKNYRVISNHDLDKYLEMYLLLLILITETPHD